jgi:glucokinase
MSSLHLGLDLGGTNIKVVVIDQADGCFQVIFTTTVETGAGGGSERAPVTTLGLGVSGRFEPDTGRIILVPNLPGEWAGLPLRSRLEDALGIPTWMVNDARAFTLAAGALGAGRGCRAVACITLGTGVGGGLLIEGKLHLGAFGVAGELGHQTVVPDGPRCGCGNRGCLEAVVRSDVLAANAGRSTAAEVFAGAGEGDKRCMDAIATMTEYLGIGLANVVAIFGPDRIVVGGGMAEAGDVILEPIREAITQHVSLVPRENLDVVPAEFGRYAGGVGAALAGVLLV